MKTKIEELKETLKRLHQQNQVDILIIQNWLLANRHNLTQSVMNCEATEIGTKEAT